MRAYMVAYYAAVVLSLAVMLGGCAGQGAPVDASTQSTAYAEQLAELDSLVAPDGVDAELWGKLTAELARVLEEQEATVGANPVFAQQNKHDVWKGSLTPLDGRGHRPLPHGRFASAPPSGAASASILSYDEASAAFSWGYYSAGDYDQNGEVNISDLTPLGANFGKAAPGGGEGEGGGFDPASIESVVDGDGNGEINIADVTPIGVNFGVVVEGYRVYRSDDIADYPGDAGEPNGPGAELVADIPLSAATGGPDERRQFSFTAEQADPPAGELAESYYWVRPYHGAKEGVPSNGWQLGAANQAPIAVLGAEPTSGLAPLTVDFQAFSSIDLDGVIVKYEWDFDGPAGGSDWLDTGSEGFVEHTYEEEGGYLAMVRVTDDDGATDTDVLPLSVRTPIAPVAAISKDPSGGITPLKVTFDASGSSDADGRIVKYEWDFDSDGEYDFDSGGNRTADFYYYEPGLFTTTVRVTDNDGLSATSFSGFVNVELGAQWHIETVDTAIWDSSTGTDPGNSQLSTTSGVLEVQGRPAVSYAENYWDRDEDPVAFIKTPVFIRAVDTTGSSWAEPIRLDHEYLESNRPYSFGLVQGHPAVVYSIIGDEESTTTRFIKANDEMGVDWPLPIDTPVGAPLSPLVTVNGNPALMVYSSSYIRAADPLGAEWGEPYRFSPLAFAPSPLVVVAGRPTLAILLGNSGLMFMRALDANGADWPSVPLQVDSEASGDRDLNVAAGHPAIAYYYSELGKLKFVRANDPEGDSWAPPVLVDVWTVGSLSMTLLDGRPAILYGDFVTRKAKFITANNAEGTSWNHPMIVETDEEAADTYRATLTTVNGNPAFVYSYAVHSGSITETYVKYVVYH